MTILDAQQTFLVERLASSFYRFVVYLQTAFDRRLLSGALTTLVCSAPKEWSVSLVSLDRDRDRSYSSQCG